MVDDERSQKGKTNVGQFMFVLLLFFFFFFFFKLKILQNFHMFLVMSALFITKTQKIGYNFLEASNVFIFKFERMCIIIVTALS